MVASDPDSHISWVCSHPLCTSRYTTIRFSNDVIQNVRSDPSCLNVYEALATK